MRCKARRSPLSLSEATAAFLCSSPTAARECNLAVMRCEGPSASGGGETGALPDAHACIAAYLPRDAASCAVCQLHFLLPDVVQVRDFHDDEVAAPAAFLPAPPWLASRFCSGALTFARGTSSPPPCTLGA